LPAAPPQRRQPAPRPDRRADARPAGHARRGRSPRRAEGRAGPAVTARWAERDGPEGDSVMMPTPEEVGLYIFILAGFLGYHVISRVPPLLHTPLMSATNAISGISLIGSLVVAGAQYSLLSTFLGFVAVTCSATNVVGGFLI